MKPCQYLKKLSIFFRHWATGLDGGNSESGFEHNSTYACFSISVELTDTGMDNYFEVQKKPWHLQSDSKISVRV